MTRTKRSASEPTVSHRRVSSSYAIIVGLGDGSMTRMLAKAPWKQLLTIRLPGEPMTEVPGYIFHCSGERDVSNVLDQFFLAHMDILTISQTEFFDRHRIGVDEALRKKFCEEFYRILGDKPLEFGDDILDGLQGAWHIAKNHRLTACPTPKQMMCGNVPAICIGAGPSLKNHYEALRQLQGKCLLIACDSLLDGLLREGITPHLVTPVERIPEIAQAFGRDDYTTIFAGKPLVHHDALKPFRNAWFAPCSDIVYGWCLAEEDELGSYGQSTGTMTVGLAAKLTAGPIYLVGHDLSMGDGKSHVSIAKAATVHNQDTFPIDGYAGTVYTDWWWDSFRRHIECTAQVNGNVINVNALDKIGAVIHGTKEGRLPDPSLLPDFRMPTAPAPNTSRHERFKARLRQLPADVKRAKVVLSSMRLTPDDTEVSHLFGQSWPMFGYILRSLYAQYSFESRAGKPYPVVLNAMRESLLNILTECDATFQDMASCG